MQAFAHHRVANRTRAILHTPLFIAILNVLDGDIPQQCPCSGDVGDSLIVAARVARALQAIGGPGTTA